MILLKLYFYKIPVPLDQIIRTISIRSSFLRSHSKGFNADLRYWEVEGAQGDTATLSCPFEGEP